MNRIFGTMLAIGLLGCAWNVVALALHLLFGASVPAIDPDLRVYLAESF